MEPIQNDKRIGEFLALVATSQCVEWCAERIGVPGAEVRSRITDYVGEVPVALALLNGIPLEGRRILDVGAGIGLTTFYLRRIGCDVTALEPGGVGFEVNHRLYLALRDYLQCGDITLLSIGAEELDPAIHGTFDVMFSANVLEHVADLEAAVSALAAALAPGGVMAHTCANYTIPYDPHYRLMLLPFAPGATPWAGARKQEPLWHSFNFITARWLNRLLRRSGLVPEFARGVMAKSFERLLSDPVFAARHSPGLAKIAGILNATGVIHLLRRWPPFFATPMVVVATKDPAPEAAACR